MEAGYKTHLESLVSDDISLRYFTHTDEAGQSLGA